MAEPKSFSLIQICGAIGLARCSVGALALKSDVKQETLEDFLAGRPVTLEVRRRVYDTLYERMMLTPIPETDRAGEGVRFRYPAAQRQAIIQSRASDGMVELESRIWLHHRWGTAG